MPGILFTYLLASQGSSRNGKTRSWEISPPYLVSYPFRYGRGGRGTKRDGFPQKGSILWPVLFYSQPRPRAVLLHSLKS